MSMGVYVLVCVYARRYVCLCKYMPKFVRINTYIHTYMHTYIGPNAYHSPGILDTYIHTYICIKNTHIYRPAFKRIAQLGY